VSESAPRSLAWRRFVRLCRKDAARWIVLESVVDVDLVTPRRFVLLATKYPGLRAVLWFRVAGLLRELGVRGVSLLIQQRLLTRFGLDLPFMIPAGGGFYIPHPVGTTIMAERIGDNVTIVGAVTIGLRDGRVPTIGDRAYLGAGARVLGGISLGEDCRVGANAVVLDDVPAGATAIGVPARVIQTTTARQLPEPA
jgi:serine O-acetyltransferase